MIASITLRRSIRKYKHSPVPRDLVEQVLEAGLLAPSSKNRQPWHFIVTTGRAKNEAVAAMKKGLLRERKTPFLPQSAPYIEDAFHTAEIMKEAPVLIFVMNELGCCLDHTLNRDERVSEICNAQSIGAAVENMCLAADSLGLGSLWICNTYFAYPELCQVLKSRGELVCALTLGYAAEAPLKRPRKAFADAVEFRE
ncbi:nitroreductase family protein [uncultured Acidaminococcus sp.]|jgi:nitroreductase|uniref:nitroreductase family protein n=1 Tax=uncultured Acidaminococcus sp. TaxID=352152 RepID=UPI0025F87A72|nr:nitroreductase family protein [uncultured Acidaminococcus sp.]